LTQQSAEQSRPRSAGNAEWGYFASDAKALLIVGGSARAAAFSALRCGWRPTCIDRFSDRDLASVCPVLWFPHGRWESVADRLPPLCNASSWLYCGPLENHPDLVDWISSHFFLLGNGGPTLRRVRDPFQVASALSRAGIPHPAVRQGIEGVPSDGSWLLKPLSSAGGRGIRPYCKRGRVLREPCFLQQRIEGQNCSAVFLGGQGVVRLVGVTRQLLGSPRSPFHYRGGIGPLRVSENLRDRLSELGQVLVSAFGLLGWFGVDFVLVDDVPWLVEVNPRFTASVELLELSERRSLLLEHLRVCRGELPALSWTAPDSGPTAPRVIGKLILYAPRAVLVPNLPFETWSETDPFRIPDMADVPPAGTRIAAGQPVLSLLASARDSEHCAARLFKSEEAWLEQIRYWDKP
jgi:predicted ATP-grasp superfamily ATP-dependent carboligase